VIGDHTTGGSGCGGDARALEIGRNLFAYNIAYDMVNVPAVNGTLAYTYMSWLATVEGYDFSGSPDADGDGVSNLRDCFRVRPDNWGVHCASSQLSIDVLQGDTTGINDIAQTFHRYTGNRGIAVWGSTSQDFDFSGAEDWSTTPTEPRGINLPGTIPGTQLNGNGYIIRDSDRAGSPNTTGTCPVYDGHWGGGWSGTMILTTLLQRLYENGMVSTAATVTNNTAPKNQTYDAVLRASEGLQRVDSCNSAAISGDDEYARYYVAALYPSASFPVVSGAGEGKVSAFAEFTHG